MDLPLPPLGCLILGVAFIAAGAQLVVNTLPRARSVSWYLLDAADDMAHSRFPLAFLLPILGAAVALVGAWLAWAALLALSS